MRDCPPVDRWSKCDRGWSKHFDRWWSKFDRWWSNRLGVQAGLIGIVFAGSPEMVAPALTAGQNLTAGGQNLTGGQPFDQWSNEGMRAPALGVDDDGGLGALISLPPPARKMVEQRRCRLSAALPSPCRFDHNGSIV